MEAVETKAAAAEAEPWSFDQALENLVEEVTKEKSKEIEKKQKVKRKVKVDKLSENKEFKNEKYAEKIKTLKDNVNNVKIKMTKTVLSRTREEVGELVEEQERRRRRMEELEGQLAEEVRRRKVMEADLGEEVAE